MQEPWEYKYKLEDFRRRYQEFSLTMKMEPRLHGNFDPISEKSTDEYARVLE